MKAKKKQIIPAAVILLLLIAAGCFFQFTGTGYRFSVPFRPGFREIAPNIYINRNNAGDPDGMLGIIEAAKERDAAFYGSLQCPENTVIIICDDPIISARIGEKDTTTVLFPKKMNYICVSNEYCILDILAHELTHAELHSRLNDKALHKIPTWFNEGLATQNDYREQYSAEQWEVQTENGRLAVPVTDMDTPAEFYAGTAEDRRYRYICAKHEVASWLEVHSVQGLLDLLEGLNAGGDFDALYGVPLSDAAAAAH